jgi:hypothetical protein
MLAVPTMCQLHKLVLQAKVMYFNKVVALPLDAALAYTKVIKP